ncbi:myelin-associated glycoprotein isoform X2 [Protopterus annectens]|uniref:myelin-associated glycoprotein isoform X2 n=1 Tax=Protopterus annectens TaxID=7888 RepID=UPI001CFA3301|nr:myelin-associated glycoprotein isoform X2 [Protopterus annectens]
MQFLKEEIMKHFRDILLIFLLLEGVLCKTWKAEMPQTISALKGSCVVIPCSFTYPPEASLSAGIHGIWYFNSPYPNNYPPVVFKSKTGIVHRNYLGRTHLLGELAQRNCTLQISDLNEDHQGKYYFRVDMGKPNIYTFAEYSELFVLEKPSIDKPEEIISEREMNITCSTPNNCPHLKPLLIWNNIEGLEGQTLSSYTVQENGAWTTLSVLSFIPTQKDQGRQLKCSILHPNQTQNFEEYLTLNINYAPRKVEVNHSMETTEGSKVVLHCSVDSSPLSDIQWLLNDEVLAHTHAEMLTWEIENVDFTHEGLYTCLAQNKHGEKNSTLYLSVKYPPRLPELSSPTVVKEGEDVTLVCSTESNPESVLSWMKGDKVLSTINYENELTLSINNVSPEDDGEYLCLAENPYGRIKNSVNITILFAPVILPESKCTAVRDGVQCVCAVKSNPEPSLLFQIPGRNITINDTDYELAHSHKSGYTVRSILELKGETATDLNVYCSAANEYGDKRHKLDFPGGPTVWAIIVGTIGGVSVFIFIIAVICIVSQSHQKKTLNESSSFVQTESTPAIYGLVQKVQENLEKTELEEII